MVEDFTPFLKLGVPVELNVVQGEMPAIPENVSELQPMFDLNSMKPDPAKETVSETGNPTNDKPESCDLCKGSGVVAFFPDGATEGVPTRCDQCRGTGMKNPPSPTPA